MLYKQPQDKHYTFCTRGVLQLDTSVGRLLNGNMLYKPHVNSTSSLAHFNISKRAQPNMHSMYRTTRHHLFSSQSKIAPFFSIPPVASMATLHVMKSSLVSPVSMFPVRKRRWIVRENCAVKVAILRLQTGKRLRVCCALKGDSNNGEEPPESLFMKELRRRGMTPTSLLEESKRGNFEVDEDSKSKQKDGSVSMKSAVSTNFEPNLADQRERSIKLNSEGLEGLIPRAKLLLTLGGTFFLAFRPFILSTIVIFSALYLYFGATFIHDGTDKPVSMPHYIDPYELLEDERIAQTAPRIN